MRGANTYLGSIGTTIFTVMSALATEHRSINLGQGFPDTEGPDDVVQAAADALKDGRNQYPPMPGVPELRQAVAAANRRFYGLDIDWATEVTVDLRRHRGDHRLPDGGARSRRRGRADRAAIRHLRPRRAHAGRDPAHRPAGAAALGPAARRAGRRVRAEDQGDPVQLADEPLRQGVHRRRTGGSSPTWCSATTPMRSATRSMSTWCSTARAHPADDAAGHARPHDADRQRRQDVFADRLEGRLCHRRGRPDAAGAEGAPEPDLHHRAQPATRGRGGAGEGRCLFRLAGGATCRRGGINLAEGLAAVGLSVLPTQGTYFITTDFAPLGFNGDDVAFCRHITEQAGVTAIPVSAFYDEPDAPRHYARFAFCKRPEVLEEAISRLKRHLSGPR